MAISIRQKIVIAAIIFYATFAWTAAAHAAIIKPANNLGLIGYWNLDERSGSTAHDHSVGAHNGTLTSSPTWTTGKLGGALTFGAANNYVVASTPWPSSGSISEWVYPTAYADWISPAGWKTDPNTSTDGYILIDNGGGGSPGKWRAVFKPNVAGPGEADAIALQNDTLNAWQYLTMTWSLSGTTYTIHLYVNGVDQGSATWTGTPGASGVGNFHFGNSGDFADNYFKGKVDDVRVYNRALSATEAKALYNQTAGTRYNSSANTLSNGSTLKNGLVGWWTFDGSTIGTTIQDSSGQGNNGYVAGSLATSSMKVAGKLGQALQFNGTNSKVTVAASASLNSGSTVSFAAWVKPVSSASGTYAVAASRSGCTGSNINWQMYEKLQVSFGGTGGPSFIVYIGGVGYLANSSTILPINQWVHLAGTYDGSLISLYVNGVLTSTSTATGARDTNSVPLSMGIEASCTNWFNGSIDDVRVYNRVLSAAEVKQLYQEGGEKVAPATTLQNGTTLATGLMGYWPFDGSTITTTVQDISGNGNNGYVSGAATSSMKVAGKLGQALQFNGSSSYVSAPGSSFNLYPITVSAWFKTTYSGAGSVGIVNKYVSSSLNGYQLFMSGGNLCAWYFKNNTASVYDSTGCTLSTAGYNDGRWHLATFIVDSSGGRLYVDGVLKGTQAWVGATPGADNNGSQALSIGTYPGSTPTPYFPGSIDEVRIYNRALSAAEAAQLYQMGK